MRLDRLLYKGIRRAYRRTRKLTDTAYTRWLFSIYRVQSGYGLESYGIPDLYLQKGATMTIGTRFKMYNGRSHTKAGQDQNCLFSLQENAVLTIGSNVTVSSFTAVCVEAITIGDNVRIGVDTCCYDSDFHSMRYYDRSSVPETRNYTITMPVVIENDCFIGNHCTILKGVRIGARAVVGPGSVVAKNIPSDEVWAGNPAQFVQKIDDDFLKTIDLHFSKRKAQSPFPPPKPTKN
ncbi:acyltransferase [Tellurirhabdus bombi]|uniref:acyltransferase n=1 Tax=Tellurirhabdus bombi TaxID=2907205 RepID=UPI001F35CB2D|nr:acyltransferase [Tellurirhabdus bombi]